ncbi:DUF748 domain-containing protein [Atopomonas sediminilitoris]|uniref:DUF748 domain-containing protein n=1 Tax=Atopomonas sediminilitoris TaxID=2919919 RepID=UPI001F4D640C|nr:DUF748 domain-containing protein [Atopomonas sediminilitoris]MCJ8168847.1 DUF748 domain-containing protein [Atopomonas sediminilitoris]
MKTTALTPRWIRWPLYGLAFWCLLGFLVIPAAVLHLGKAQLAQWVKVPSSLERVGFNPFTLELEIKELWLGPKQDPLTGFSQLKVDVSWSSLWAGALALDNVQLRGIRHHAEFDQQGHFNLLQALNLPASSDEASSEPFPLRIKHLHLQGERVSYRDQRPQPEVAFNLTPLNIELHNLSTLPDEQAELQLNGTGPNGATLAWQGQISILPLQSRGRLSLSNIPLPVWWPYAQGNLALALSAGTLDIAADYTVDLQHTLALSLSNLDGQLSKLAVNIPKQADTHAQLASLSIKGAAFDLQQRRVNLGQINSQGLSINAKRFKDGRLDWQSLITQDSGATDAADAQTTSEPWQISLQQLTLSDYRLALRDEVPNEAVQHSVGPLQLTLKDYHSSKPAPLPITLSTGLGKQGQLSVNGSLQPMPLQVELSAQAERLDLRQLQHYLEPFVRVELRSGWLGGDFKVSAKQEQALALNATGRLTIEQLHTLDALKGRDLVRWQAVDVNGIDFALNQHLNIAEVVLRKPFARFIVNEDRSTNVSQLLVPQAATKPAPENPNPLAINLQSIRVEDGSANFADFSLTPEFDAGIEQLNGQISGINSTNPAPAKIDIKGKVDRYAPVVVRGNLTPFDPLNKLDMLLSFNKVELTTLTPYSGKFAGYSIRKGRMSLDLGYKIENGRLQASNKILLEKLQLGEQVDSPDAVKLPVRLGLALMTDTDGNIDLDIPLTGDLNDPEFRVAPLVFKAIGNLIAKAAASPFKLLGGLIPGEDVNLGEVSFSAGSAELNASAQKSLSQLAEALQQKPVLRLEIEGVAARDPDSLPEAQKRLERELKRGYYRILQRRGEDVPDSRLAVTVPDDFRPALLSSIYRERIGHPPADWAQQDQAAQAQQAEQALIAFWQNSEVLLRKLAQARSSAIKDFLVEKQQLAPERLFLLDARVVAAGENNSVTSPLHLEVQ